MDSNKYMLFSGATKMADLILRDYRILTLLPRFDITLGFADKTICEVCSKYGVDEHFFLLVCNIHTFDDYLPEREDLMKIDLKSMIKYLRRSHSYYIGNRIASIEQKLKAITNCCSEYHDKILGNFFAEYKQEVLGHFAYEDQEVFPCIEAMLEGKTQDFKIDQYEEHHDNIDDKLSDLKNIIIKYLPDGCSTEERNDILFDIFLFEEDLTKHTRIENKVLIPYVRETERGYGKE